MDTVSNNTKGLRKKVCYVSLSEENWLCTNIGKEDHINWYFPAHKENCQEKTVEAEENWKWTDSGIELAREVARIRHGLTEASVTQE